MTAQLVRMLSNPWKRIIKSVFVQEFDP
jgi:hypothetical protein